jgi:anti-anti-sigma factor
MQGSEPPPPDPRLVVVELVGEIDAATRTATIDEVRRALSREPLAIAVDLSRVSFMDCAGLGALVEARAIAEQAGCALYARSPSRPAAWLLELAGLLDHLTGPESSHA